MKKVLFFVGSRANYASIKSAISACIEHPELSTEVVLYASAVSPKFGDLISAVTQDGIKISREVHTLVQADTPQGMAESTGLALLKIPQVISELAPDIVITVGDRFETLAVAISAAYMNVPLGHTMGGEITGSIDESVRHAITKLSHIHFPATKEAAKNIIALGENSDHVFVVGCPRIDLARAAKSRPVEELQQRMNEFGFGDQINLSAPFLLVSQHPVTTELKNGQSEIEATLDALDYVKCPTILLWPNSDAGHEESNKVIRRWSSRSSGYPKRLFRNLPPEIYLKLMSLTSCLIGNSSSGIREGSYLGTPVVNIGSRQNGREHFRNVINCLPLKDEIITSIGTQIRHGTYSSSPIYGNGESGVKIAEILAGLNPVNIQKRLKF